MIGSSKGNSSSLCSVNLLLSLQHTKVVPFAFLIQLLDLWIAGFGLCVCVCVCACVLGGGNFGMVCERVCIVGEKEVENRRENGGKCG